MHISKSRFYTILFVIVLFLQLYLPSFKANLFIQVGMVALYFLIEKITITESFLIKTIPVLLLLLLGFAGTLIHKYEVYNIIKDIFHFLKPVLGLLVGYLFYKKINNFSYFIKTIILCGFASAVLHFIILMATADLFSGSVERIREFGKDNFLELFAVFFLLYYKKFYQETLFSSVLKRKAILIVLLVSNILYFSRTMIVVAIILFLSIEGHTILTKKAIRFLAVFTLLIMLFYVFLFSVKIERDKPGMQAFLYKIKIAPAEIFKTKIDRENHKDLWDHWRGYEVKRAFALMKDNPSSFVFGTGYGSLVNLKFYAPLTGEKNGIKYISELHNGYMYVFYKTGALGIIILLIFFTMLYRTVYFNQKDKKFVTLFISAIGLIYLFTTLTITGIYNGRDVIIFILGAFLYFERKTNFQKEISE
ncbi:hypothetical protein H4V97_001950 [Flavobacterium sp. CG_23.5]|uniref:O-antigen ligase family protein n=1 Tax=Flavobacterium sp. CG_23.5 TaxID=2760708 RepID=UPI001AE4D6B0|nr:O-antigen ligase family protein [Flavobacterium sp. CG_23.5]MBP2283632.1 hypothetical protein [Flavobacterium sp. CG_23.5]